MMIQQAHDHRESFRQSLSNGEAKTITDDFRLGMYEFSVRRLCDLDIMHSPERILKQGKFVWVAEWKTGTSLSIFLHDPELQHRLFERSMSSFESDGDLMHWVGQKVDDVEITQSGVLAVAHRAGKPGAVSWFTNFKDRTKFLRTSQAFKFANGIF